MLSFTLNTLLAFASLVAFSQPSNPRDEQRYRAWKHAIDCQDLNGGNKQLIWFIGSRFFAPDVYVELEKLDFKHTHHLIRAESMAEVDEQLQRIKWAKANQSKYSDPGQLRSATIRAVQGDSPAHYLQKKGQLSVSELCKCFNREKAKAIPGVDELRSKSSELPFLEAKAKAVCLKSLYKPPGLLSW
jgi:hypothetical protein